MNKGRRARAAAFLVAALALTTAGQLYFFYHRGYLWDGLVFHGLGAIFFVLAWRTARVRSRPGSAAGGDRPSCRGLLEKRTRIILLSVGLLLSCVTIFLGYGRTSTQSATDTVIVWLLSILAVGLALLWPGTPLRTFERLGKLDPRAVSREAWLEIATIGGLGCLAFLLRATALERVPYTLGGDEAWHGLLARQVLSGELRNPFVMGYLSMPTFFYWPLSWSLWAVGDNIVGLRLPAALAGALTVVGLYLVARRLWGHGIALIGSVVLATYEFHIHFSRLGASNVWDPLFVVATLGFLDSGLTSDNKERGRRLCALAGLAMGMSVYFYTGARLLPVLALAYVAFLWAKNAWWGRGAAPEGVLGQRLVPETARGPGSAGQASPGTTRGPSKAGEDGPEVTRGLAPERARGLAPGRTRGLVVFLLVSIVVAAPMLGFALARPDDWNARVNQVGIVQSGWLAREIVLTGRTTLHVLSDQFLRAVGAFHVFADRTVWYGAERPLLGFLAGLFAILGVAWAFLRWRDRRYFLVLLWFWGVVIAGGMLTESPPSSQRLVMASPAVALFVAFGLAKSVRLAQRILNLKQRFWAGVAVVGLTVVIGVLSVRYYFVDLAPSRQYGSETGETATMLGYYLQGLDGRYDVYLYGAPEIYWSFGTMSFLAPLGRGHDVVVAEDTPPATGDDPVLFVFLPERMAELARVRQAFPDGRLERMRDRNGRVRFAIYRLD